jgi:hypothetical protein
VKRYDVREYDRVLRKAFFRAILVVFCIVLSSAALWEFFDWDQSPHIDIILMIITLCTLLAGATALIMNLRFEETSKLICRNCGYCLRGLREPRCPECGESFDAGLIAGDDENESSSGI